MAQIPPLQNQQPSEQRTSQMQKIIAGADASLTDSMQKELNKPLQTSGVSAEDHTFLDVLVQKVEKGEINLMDPTTLLNRPVYDGLDEMAQGKADYDAVRLLPKLREIYRLYEGKETETYQFEYLVRDIRLLKEGIEQVAGDIFLV